MAQQDLTVPDWLTPGMYGLTCTFGPAAEVIKVFTLSHINHAFVYIGAHEDIEHAIVQATPGKGVIVSPLSLYPRSIFNRHEVFAPGQAEGIVATALSTVGSEYGFLSIAAIGLAEVGLDHHLLDEFATKRHEFICSQNVDYCYAQNGIQCFNDGRPENMVRPDDLLERLLDPLRLG